MLDTVILTIRRGLYSVPKPHMFTPNANIIRGAGHYLVRCINNPTALDIQNGIYKPKLTLVKRMTRNGDELPLKIEFSVAKILFKNNLDEVQESDFEAVVEALRKATLNMGVSVANEQIANASVSAISPSKNIELTGGYKARFVIKELNKVNTSKKIDMDHKDYRNEGECLQFYTNLYSLVAYDKVLDLKKPEKRAIDKDQNTIQRPLFGILKEQKKEILRIEARLSKKPKLNAVLKEFGYPKSPTFKDVFKKELCQKILQKYWQELIADRNLFLFDIETSPQKTLEKVFRNKQGIKLKEALSLVGLWATSKEGIRSTRAIAEQYVDRRTWYRIAEELPFLDTISDKQYHGWVKQINDSLTTFKPYRVTKDEPTLNPLIYKH